jgi:Tfp pilus assembly protein FimT
VEVLFVIGILAVVGSMAVPALTAGIERARTRAAARYLSAELGLARTQAVTRGAAVAMRFESSPSGTILGVVMDGNGNGVRIADIDAGVDGRIDRPWAFDEAFPGVRFALASDPAGNAIQLGGTALLTFTPEGTSTSGSLVLLGRDGSQFAIRVLGATGRIRTQRLDLRTSAWVDVL